VFKARHCETGELVAIKILCADDARDPLLLKRFEQEFHAVRTLDDPRIVRGLDFGRQGALYYLVMEFLDGKTLHEHLQVRGCLPESEALSVVTQIGQALHHAHERGMIHRDVKPKNILLTTDGRVCLTDFGLVKWLESGVNLTLSRMALGTPCFMAPEQFDDSKRIDRRCDVYGLAATLYMAITGETPFLTKRYLSTLRKKVSGEIAPPRQLVPGLCMRVDWAILRALSPSPAMRPSSCAEFIRDLTGCDLPGAEALAQPFVEAVSADEVVLALPPDERRAAIRYACRQGGVCLVVGASGQKSWEGEVRDISVGGLGLVLGRRFEPGTDLTVGWDQQAKDVPQTVLARVVRAESQLPSQWLLGCQLTRRLSDQEVRALFDAWARASAMSHF
jgi:serine/threonine protein kinase